MLCGERGNTMVGRRFRTGLALGSLLSGVCLKHFLRRTVSTKARWLALASLVVAIAGVTGVAARADVFSDLGLLPGGSLQLLPPAQLTDPPPQGSAKEPLLHSPVSDFTCRDGATSGFGPFGYVVLNTHGPKNLAGEDSVVSVEVVVEGGDPNATYQIFL